MQVSRFMLCLALVTVGCSDEDSAVDLGERSSKAILASEGGTIALKSGTTLEIPAGALGEDTTITITEVLGRGSENSRLGGLVMEPDGLVFAQPATVRFPLPADWDPEQPPLVYYARGSDPSWVLPSGEEARVVEAEGGYVSEHLIHHFSCTAAAANCHAGTLKHIINTIEKRGCADAERAIFAAAKKKYAGIEIDKSDCASAGPDQIQAVLDTFFEDKGGWDPGVAMPAEMMQQAIEATRAGQLVVLAFSDQAWGSRAGKHNFYPGGLRYAHTAPLLVENDAVVVRNTIRTPNYELQTHFGGAVGGEVAITWPLARLEEMRSIQTGVMIETAACGAPDCLAYADRNKWKISILNPVEGIDETAGGGMKFGPRPVAWPSVRLYIERAPQGAPNRLVSRCPAGGDEGDQPDNTTYAVWATGNVECWGAPHIFLTDRESFEREELASSFEGGGTDSTTLVDKKLLQDGFATEDEARAWICPQFTAWRVSYWCGRHDLIGEQKYWYAGSLGCDFSSLPLVE